MNITTKQKIIIVTHELVYGVPQALRDYLIRKKSSQLLFIGLPFFVSRKTSCALYKEGKLIVEKTTPRKRSFGIIDYFLDLLQIIWSVSKSPDKYDVFVGVNSLNCFAGLFLKKIGKVNKVIFYTMDFVPIRFENKILNYIFHQIEIVCVKYSDEVWNVSPRMAKGRERYLGLSAKRYSQKFIPVGIWNEKIKKRSFGQIKKNQVLFIGHLLEKQGVQMVLESLPIVIKEIEDVKFLIVGGGEYERYLKDKVKDLNLKQNVSFTGWITNRNRLDQMISESAVAVATYKPEKEMLRNFTYFADPNKLKDYLGAGLPIVLTDISYNAKEIEKRKCGIMVNYNKNEIAKALIELLKNEETYKQYRANALSYAKELDWMNVYGKIFK